MYNLYIHWNTEKSEILKQTRGISFEEVMEGELITVLSHPAKINQRILVFEYNDYCWAAPCVIEGDIVFLKTLYPSRKLTKIYLNQE